MPDSIKKPLEFQQGMSSDDFLNALLRGDRQSCALQIKNELKQNPSIIDLYETFFKPALYQIGKLWETNRISVASEHLATAIVESLLNELFEHLISKRRYNRKVVLACIEKEKHQVGIKMVADVFEMNGWESFFLGTGIPYNELIRYIHEVNPDVIALSLSVYLNWGGLLQLLERLNLEFPDKLILVGGQALRRVQSDVFEVYKNVVYISDLYLLNKWIERMNKMN